ncbi:DUF6868 family protein [Gimesia aquarii]|uniref:DUF6868 domain-containing protein n=1 Tax=Gimesia aquarii TaxID=2527964 RepID=A0A517VYX5_9PLAN|nr:hypothetical protein [Gimesia aquarii]QDT98202.1 hypothetical protein V144x_36880 [Gimesia aquarii]
MDTQTLTTFFMWCTIFNGGVLILWTFFFMFAPDYVYRLQSKWFPLPRETFDVVIYSLLGLFKLVFIAFSLVPYLALLMIG